MLSLLFQWWVDQKKNMTACGGGNGCFRSFFPLTQMRMPRILLLSCRRVRRPLARQIRRRMPTFTIALLGLSMLKFLFIHEKDTIGTGRANFLPSPSHQCSTAYCCTQRITLDALFLSNQSEPSPFGRPRLHGKSELAPVFKPYP